MKAIETKKSVKYTAEVWLKYQHQIQYRFLIVAGGEEVFASASREARAGHVISEKWQPCLGQLPESGSKKEKRRAPRTGGLKEPKPAHEIKSVTMKPLRNPPFFEQIRSLIDDLL